MFPATIYFLFQGIFRLRKAIIGTNLFVTFVFFFQVFFVDHGFNEVVDKAKLYKLDRRFCSLAFQAAKCKLAGK